MEAIKQIKWVIIISVISFCGWGLSFYFAHRMAELKVENALLLSAQPLSDNMVYSEEVELVVGDNGQVMTITEEHHGTLAEHGDSRSEYQPDDDYWPKKISRSHYGERPTTAYFQRWFTYRIDSVTSDTTCYKSETCED